MSFHTHFGAPCAKFGSCVEPFLLWVKIYVGRPSPAGFSAATVTPAVQDKVGDFSKTVLAGPGLPAALRHPEGSAGCFAGNKARCAEQANPKERPGTAGEKPTGKNMFSSRRTKRAKSLWHGATPPGRESAPRPAEAESGGPLAPGSLRRRRDRWGRGVLRAGAPRFRGCGPGPAVRGAAPGPAGTGFPENCPRQRAPGSGSRLLGTERGEGVLSPVVLTQRARACRLRHAYVTLTSQRPRAR